jgi:methylated-DNA-[protein]-cysteine S-methyltransferase
MTESIQFSSAIGLISLSSSQNALTSVLLDGPRFEINPESGKYPLLETAKFQLLEYFNGKRKAFDLALGWDQLQGFQRDVLKIISDIAFGEILTYGQIASRLKKPNASRAVGAALARNPLPIFIPCHRVVAANGQLTGYLGKKGIATKKWLLELEGHRIVGEKLG